MSSREGDLVTFMFLLNFNGFVFGETVTTQKISNTCSVEKEKCLKSLDLKVEDKDQFTQDQHKELARCLFGKKEVTVSPLCHEELDRVVSEMSWFTRQLFKAVIL